MDKEYSIVIMAISKQKINKIFAYFQSNIANPQTELEYINDYTLLVAVVLSAQATDIGVNKATKLLFTKVTSPAQMLELGEENLKKHIKSIGLFNSKAKNIIKLSHDLITKFNGRVPDNRKDLESLSGVGQKTASVVLNALYGHETIAVDTHVFRVSNRIGLVKTTSPAQTEEELLKAIPKKWVKNAHHWLILHGRYVCKAQKPLCMECKISHLCNTMSKK